MKRKKQIVRNIILIALTVLLFLWQGGYHLTPEGVFRSAEKAEWLGPTPEVMELGTSDDGCLRFVGIEQKDSMWCRQSRVWVFSGSIPMNIGVAIFQWKKQREHGF